MNRIDRELIGKTISGITEDDELVPATHGTGLVRMTIRRMVFADGSSAIMKSEDDGYDTYMAIRMEKK